MRVNSYLVRHTDRPHKEISWTDYDKLTTYGQPLNNGAFSEDDAKTFPSPDWLSAQRSEKLDT